MRRTEWQFSSLIKKINRLKYSRFEKNKLTQTLKARFFFLSLLNLHAVDKTSLDSFFIKYLLKNQIICFICKVIKEMCFRAIKNEMENPVINWPAQ